MARSCPLFYVCEVFCVGNPHLRQQPHNLLLPIDLYALVTLNTDNELFVIKPFSEGEIHEVMISVGNSIKRKNKDCTLHGNTC